MSAGNDLTLQAVRLAMSMSQVRADFASQNIAQASTPGAQAVRVDFGRSQGLLEQAIGGANNNEQGLLVSLSEAALNPASSEHRDALGTAINLDEEVADMASANLKYTALTESLNRHFGLMRLAISGRN
jgi:flagellar basal-body rod protein FlgB